MNASLKLLIFTTLIAQPTAFAQENTARQEIEAKISKEGSYEYNLVGRRLLRPIDDTLLRRLAANPDESADHDFVLSRWLLRIAAESNRKYLWLLDNEELRRGGNPLREEISDILLAYDYNVNGNKKALDSLLERVRKSIDKGHSWGSARTFALASIDEWDLSKQALGSGWMSADGAGGDERYGFWLKRRYFFPNSEAFPKDYEAFWHELEELQSKAEQGGAGEPATRTESDSKGSDKPHPESEGRSR